MTDGEARISTSREWTNFNDDDTEAFPASSFSVAMTDDDIWSHDDVEQAGTSNHQTIRTQLPCLDPDHVSFTWLASAAWFFTTEQLNYYLMQFSTLQKDLDGLVSGSIAKEYFEKSQLPRTDLCAIWALSDVDEDGFLDLAQFCVAMHLVVLKRNGGWSIPPTLPPYLTAFAKFTSPGGNAPSCHEVRLNELVQYNKQLIDCFRRDSVQSISTSKSGVATQFIGPFNAGLRQAIGDSVPSKTAIPSMETPSVPPHRKPSAVVESPMFIDSNSENLVSFDARLPIGVPLSQPVAVRPKSSDENNDMEPLKLYDNEDMLSADNEMQWCMSTLAKPSILSPMSSSDTRAFDVSPIPPPVPRRNKTVSMGSGEHIGFGAVGFSQFHKSNEKAVYCEETVLMKQQLERLVSHCKDLVLTNHELWRKWKDLKETRISLEIQKERLVPLQSLG